MHSPRLNYRPEIDGLRAVSVLGVLIFHLNRAWLPGGFVGVDIFFVISGYLITSVLYSDCEGGVFSFGRFYQRRIARIFPVFFLVALATITGAAFVYSSQDFASAGANLVATLLSVANVKYMLQGNYFGISPDAQPFLHYWSLSVEEQFYIVFPCLLFLVFRYKRNYLSPILGLLTLASMVACVLTTQANSAWAFYLLPTRAWELGAGCFLAITLSKSNGHPPFAPRALSAAGLLLIVLCFAEMHEGPWFPGWQAMFPVVGAVAIILDTYSHGWATKFLSSRTAVSIGKMSYSLYLWHWPVFSLIDYKLYLLSAGMRIGLKISVSFLLTLLTFHFIEKPARIYLNRPQSRRISFAATAALLALLVPLGISIRYSNYVNADPADLAKGGLVFLGKARGPSVVLMGDSNASMYGKAMKEICLQFCSKLTVISVAAGDSLPSRKRARSELWVDSLDILRDTRPDFVVIANHWVDKLRDEPDRLKIALNEIKPYVGHVILLNQPPILPGEASRAYMRNGARPPFQESPEARTERRKANEFLLTFESRFVTVLDISSYFESERGDILFADAEGRELYQDSTHLSGLGVERIHHVLQEAIAAGPVEKSQ